MVASSSSAPPLWGLWHPPQERQPEKDYLTTAEVLANPIEAANRFFAGLKPIMKTAGQIEQQEMLISRIECRLLGCSLESLIWLVNVPAVGASQANWRNSSPHFFVT